MCVHILVMVLWRSKRNIFQNSVLSFHCGSDNSSYQSCMANAFTPHLTPTSQAPAQLFFFFLKVSSGMSPKGAVPTNLRTSVLLCFFGPDFSRPSQSWTLDLLCCPYPKASLPSTCCAALTQHRSGDRNVFFTISEAAGPAVRAWSLYSRWYRITVSSWDRRERG